MEEYWRWFMYQTKILPEQRVKCLEYFETPENMFIAPAAKVEKAEFLSEAAREELLRTRTAGELSREEKELQEKEIDFYSMEHPAYPARLREIPHAPCGLFVKGRLPQFEKEKKHKNQHWKEKKLHVLPGGFIPWCKKPYDGIVTGPFIDEM